MFNFEDFRARAAARLLTSPKPTWDRSDDDMNEKARLIPENTPRVSAAVLIPIVMRDQPTVLLTQRHAGLAKHAGQIAFPGGRVDAGESAVQAALREAGEEVGLAASHINTLGFLGCYLTVTNYLVTPVVAEVSPGFELTLQAGEVEEAFEVPLAFLMDVANCRRHQLEWKGLTRHYYAYQFEKRHIWGATAGMIRNLHDTLYS